MAASASAAAEGVGAPTGLDGHNVPDNPASFYRIGPGDTLFIVVFGSDALTRTALVRPDGYIDLPLAETVRAAGLTTNQLAVALTERLSATMIEPTVDVSVIEAAGASDRVRVIGATGKANSIPFEAGMRVLDAVEAVGGLEPTADGNSAVLFRGTQSRPVRLDDVIETGNGEANVPLQPGDTIVIPQGFFAGEWRQDYALSVGATLTDNYNLEPDGEAALILSMTPQMTFAGESARIRAAAELALTGEVVTLAENDQRLVPNVLALSTTEVARDSIFVDAAAVVAEVALDPRAATSGSARNNLNRTLVQAYEASPYLITRIPDVGTIETRYTLAGLLTDDSGNRTTESFGTSDAALVDSVINRVEVRFSEPKPASGRLGTDALAYGAVTARFGAPDVTEFGAVSLPTYRLARGLALVGRAGYSRLDVGRATLSGPDLAVGAEYNPSPSLSFRAVGGWRLEHPQADVLLRWESGPATLLTAGYTDTVGVGQAQLIDTLSNLEYDSKDQRFINQRTRLAYLTTPSGLTLDNSLSQTRRFDLTAAQTLGANRVALTGFASRQKPVDSGAESSDGSFDSVDQFAWGLIATGERRLTRSISSSLQAGYRNIDSKDDGGAESADNGRGDFRDLVAGFDVAYAFSDVVSIVVGYRYTRRFADQADDEYTENLFFTGVTRRF